MWGRRQDGRLWNLCLSFALHLSISVFLCSPACHPPTDPRQKKSMILPSRVLKGLNKIIEVGTFVLNKRCYFNYLNLCYVGQTYGDGEKREETLTIQDPKSRPVHSSDLSPLKQGLCVFAPYIPARILHTAVGLVHWKTIGLMKRNSPG